LKTEIIGIHSQMSHNGRMNEGPGNDVMVNNDPSTASGKGAASAQIYSRVVERYAMFFDRPEARLRFMNNTLAKQADRQDRLQRRFRRFRILERTRIYNWALEARCYSAILEEIASMASFLPKNHRNLSQRVQAPFSARLSYLLHETRHAFYGAAVMLLLMTIAGLYTLGEWSAHGVNAYLAKKYNMPAEAAPAPSPTPDPFNTILFKPEKVWLVDTEDGLEKWSNGCRISKRYETSNRQRSYYTIPRRSELAGDQVSDKIIGILYHTPENYMYAFNPDNNRAIKNGSRGLLVDVQKNKKYNYVIDRIGEIYRIVRDDHTAYHAGDSLWADTKNTYVFLNESFLGVCFESKFEGATSLDQIVTKAQINSGILLTEVLRSRYNIDDANCTTHGLVAVDPDTMLIARHHDWVHFFPFEAMGLSNKYKVRPPTMTDYGFTYNEELLAKKLGHKLWEGASAAEEEFNRQAELARVSPEELRLKLRDRYLAQRNKTLGLHAEQGDVNNPRLDKIPSAAGETTASGADQSTSAAWKALIGK
jgi:N-acetyl-anhydromuramyl-L-alanine amidase AmpD